MSNSCLSTPSSLTLRQRLLSSMSATGRGASQLPHYSTGNGPRDSLLTPLTPQLEEPEQLVPGRALEADVDSHCAQSRQRRGGCPTRRSKHQCQISRRVCRSLTGKLCAIKVERRNMRQRIEVKELGGCTGTMRRSPSLYEVLRPTASCPHTFANGLNNFQYSKHPFRI